MGALAPLAGFIVERGKSLISKKLGAAVVAEVGAAGTPLQGYPLIIYLVAQAALDGWKYFVDTRYGDGPKEQ